MTLYFVCECICVFVCDLVCCMCFFCLSCSLCVIQNNFYIWYAFSFVCVNCMCNNASKVIIFSYDCIYIYIHVCVCHLSCGERFNQQCFKS